jgi:serine/threonine protein kinase
VVTPGTTLDARWRLDEILAVGSMGEVFRGTDLVDGSRCAVKVLRAEFIDDGVQVQRFEREARTTLSLRHPNVVIVHASGVLGDRPWIAMELLEGESLERRLEHLAARAPSDCVPEDKHDVSSDGIVGQRGTEARLCGQRNDTRCAVGR